VGPETITEEQVQEILDQSPAVGRPPDAKRRVLDRLIETNIFALEAKKAGLLDDPEFKRRLNITTTYVLARSFFDLVVEPKAIPSDEAALKDYEANKEAYVSPAQIQCQHILVEDKKTAEELLARLKKGESFEELAKKESKDPTSAAKGGDLGWQSAGSLDPAFAAAASALKKNELSKPVQSRYGWHIIKLTDRKDKRQMSFEEVKAIVKESMRRREAERLRKEYLDKADVEIFLPEEPQAKPEGKETTGGPVKK
jgi:peptidyl-prolyl cis-trans isomerase C